jgi:hypothetical protein
MKKLAIAFIGLVMALNYGMSQTQLKPPQGALAFPAESAGISAYVKTDKPIRITDALTKAFYNVQDVSDSHIIGTVEVEHFVGKVYPHVYVDTAGWIVAFFLAAEPTALVMYWSGDTNNPTAAIKTTLEVALEKVAEAARLPLTQPSFYDFRFPEANSMLILLRILPAADTKVMYVKLPENHVLYIASYYFYGCNFCRWENQGWYTAELWLDGAMISRVEGQDNLKSVVKDIPSRDFQIDQLHELKISLRQNRECGSAGVALVLIYRAP